MVQEIRGPGHDQSPGVTRSNGPKGRKPAKPTDSVAGSGSPAVEVSGELNDLISRVKQAEVFRKDRVHQVLEKLQRGELVTSETVRDAAERLLQGGP